MPARVTILDRTDALIGALEGMPEALANHAIHRGTAAGTALMRKNARASSAFRDKTGRLRKSIRSRAFRSKVLVIRNGREREIRRPVGSLLLAGGRGARQAHLIELGTVRSRARAFIVPAFTRHQNEVNAAIAQGIRTQVSRVLSEIQRGALTKTTRRLIAL